MALQLLSFHFPPFCFVLLTAPNSAAQDFCTLLFTICCKRKKKETASQYCNNRVLLEGIPFRSAYSLSKHVSYNSSISPYYSKGLMFCLSFAYSLFFIPWKHQFFKTSSLIPTKLLNQCNIVALLPGTKKTVYPTQIHDNQTAFSWYRHSYKNFFLLKQKESDLQVIFQGKTRWIT